MWEDEVLESSSDTESQADSLDTYSISEDSIPFISAEEISLGRDIQGVPWERLRYTSHSFLHPIIPVLVLGGDRRTRDEHRLHRLQNYRNYTNVLDTHGAEYQEYLTRLMKDAVHPKQESFFDFVSTSRRVKSTIVHFQLRNLLQATSKHDIYVMHDNSVNHWNLMSDKCSTVLNFQRPRAFPNGSPGFSGELENINVSTLTTGNGFLAVGGFTGQLVVQRLSDLAIVHESFVTQNENGITNAIEIFDSSQAGGSDLKILTSNNDSYVRIFDISTFKVVYTYQCEWAINYSTVSPSNSKIIALVGDDVQGRLLDRSANRVICHLVGHEDYSFAAAWNPANEYELATGNQDLTTRLWDIRSPDKERKILRGKMGAMRSLRYSSNGAFLVMSEPTDLVHLYNAKNDYQSVQEIDLFGEISGAVFSPDADMMYVSIVDESYSCLVQFRRKLMENNIFE